MQIEKEVEKIEHSITEYCDPILLNQLETAKAELDELYNYITKGSILRSKVRWFEHGRKSEKYFLAWRKETNVRLCTKAISQFSLIRRNNRI